MTEYIQQLSRAGKIKIASVVDVGKYRAPYAPSIAPTDVLNNHKENAHNGGLANRLITRKEINTEEIPPPTGKGVF